MPKIRSAKTGVVKPPMESENYFQLLPLEMKEKILDELSFKDKMNARRVCQSFKEIVDRRTKVTFTLSDKSLEAFSGVDEDRQIETLAVEDLSNKLGIISRSRSRLMKCVKHLKILPTRGIIIASSACDFCGNLECPENMETWIAGKGTCEDNVISILRLHPSIQQLTLGPMCFQHITRFGRLSGFRLEALTRLNMHFGDDDIDMLIHDGSSPSSYQNFMKNNFPSLRVFVFDNKACAKPIDLLISAYEFICRHHASLQSVTINSERSYEYMFYPRRLENWVKNLTAIEESIKLVQLKDLLIRTAAIIPPQLSLLKTFEEEFVRSQTKLESATVSFVDSEMTGILGFVPACKDQLKSLRVDSGIYKIQTCPFDCGVIKDCKNLGFLDLDIDNREWNWFSTDRRESKIENVHLLPPSIHELRIEGHLPMWKNDIIFGTLRNLRKFVSTGYGRCGKNIPLIQSVLKNSTIQIFTLDNDKCKETEDYCRSLKQRPGLRMIETWSGFVFRIDRSKFDRNSV